MEATVRFVIFLMFLLVIIFFYGRFFSARAPMGDFNDVMSHYVWKNKRKRKAIRRNEHRRVKNHEMNKTMAALDGAFTDKVHNLADKVEQKTSKLAEVHKNKILPVKDHLVRKTKKIVRKISKSLDEGPSKKEQLISQMREVYQND